ncbi:MAG: 2-succinyl-6-hydroxy-2,4-cyclohexadiene-1-carboxylate synthase [Chloroflexota bacterium]|nr:2-succinyl-6-hydroxy-2,4-cyclohexadiene-1-carboxylate synthase [Chloroflexota bacterium]
MRLNDLDFHVEIDGNGPPLLLLHGFTGSVRAWDALRPAIRSFARLITIDLIGHGRSAVPDDPARYSLEWSTRDLAALLDGLELDVVDVLGYSMGGRVALQFAVDAPERVRTLILESASPGIEDDLQRRRRMDSDAALAERILADGIEAFVAEWERLPLLAPAAHVSEVDRLQHTAERLRNNPLGLANSLRGMGAGQQTPLWPALADLEPPVLLIVGERDPRYRHIAERMRALIPRCKVAVVASAGHTVHVDAPDTFVRLVEAALDDPKSGPGRLVLRL